MHRDRAHAKRAGPTAAAAIPPAADAATGAHRAAHADRAHRPGAIGSDGIRRAAWLSASVSWQEVRVTQKPITFASLFATHTWRPIPGCPGRYVLEGNATLRDVVGESIATHAHRSARARDEVLVTPLDHGAGLITYRRSDGTERITLGDASGFARKLAQLELRDPIDT